MVISFFISQKYVYVNTFVQSKLNQKKYIDKIMNMVFGVFIIFSLM